MRKKFASLGFQGKNGTRVSFATSEERYLYTIDRALKTEAVWCLSDCQGDLVLPVSGRLAVCIWPTAQAAQDFADIDLHNQSRPRKISLAELMETAQQLQQEGHYWFAVYPTRDSAYIAAPKLLLTDLTTQDLVLKPQF